LAKSTREAANQDVAGEEEKMVSVGGAWPRIPGKGGDGGDVACRRVVGHGCHLRGSGNDLGVGGSRLAPEGVGRTGRQYW